MEDKPVKGQKGRYRLKYRGTECLNCGHPLAMSDKFCPNCSQANSTKKLSLKDFFDEFFSSLISYDSKLLKTLSALLLRPGKITNDYINGKRVSYTNPFRFLLSLAIVYFLIINFTGNFSRLDKYGSKIVSDLNVDDGLSNLNIDAGVDSLDLGSEIDSLKNSVAYLKVLEVQKRRDSAILNDPKAYFKKMAANENDNHLIRRAEFFLKLLEKDSIYEFSDAAQKFGVSESFGNKMAFDGANGLFRLRQRPGTFVSTMISKIPFAIFFFLPVFALFIWLVYIRKKYTYTDHLVFSFHNTSLLFILLIISYLIDSIFEVNSNWIFFTLFSVYLFEAMRKFYHQGIFKTIVKYLFLNAIFFILALSMTLIFLTGNLYTY